MKGKKLLSLMGALIALAVVLSGCQTSLSSLSTGAPVAAGMLQINITDAPPDLAIEQVWLTVVGVKIHQASSETMSTTTTETTITTETTTATTTTEAESSNGWLSLDLNGPTRFDLLEYQGGSVKKLAVGYLAEGTYTQIRLDITLVEIKLKDDPILKVAKLPSNTLKFVHPFEIAEGRVTEILFDFDALESINETGNGKFICKPVIKLTTTREAAGGNLEITPLSLPNGVIGNPYNTTVFSVTGGTPSYTWSISSGIPDGLSFNTNTAILSGTPTAAGTFTFSIIVKDSAIQVNNSATKQFTVNIALEALKITTSVLPSGTVGTEYSQALTAIGGNPDYTWAVTAGNLPSGLSLSTNGIISGTPDTAIDYNFTVQVTDSTSPTPNTATQVLAIHIDAAP